MAENTDEQDVDNLAETQPENLLKETHSTDTINLQQETENMETHAHELHKAPGHGWKHYLFEFFMLFLAVFCGFLAENTREHFAEHSRAKEYAKNFLIDLKNDNAELDNSIRYDSLIQSMADTLINFIGKSDIKSKGGQFYYLSHIAPTAYITDWNRATLNQLISSGNLRYFTNITVVDKINVYNTTQANISALQESIVETGHGSALYRNQLFKANEMIQYYQFTAQDILDGTKSGLIDSLKKRNTQLQSYDSALLNNYANSLLSTRTNRSYLLNGLYVAAKKEAIEIIDLLKKEYHIE